MNIPVNLSPRPWSLHVSRYSHMLCTQHPHIPAPPYTFYRISLFWRRIGFAIELIHWGRDKMDAISQTPFSSTFSWMKMLEFRLKFHWSLFPRAELTIFQHWFQIMVWRRPSDKPLSEPMMVSLATHICVTRPQWLNEHIANAHLDRRYFDNKYWATCTYLDIDIALIKKLRYSAM